jgi:hypothetical protein
MALLLAQWANPAFLPSLTREGPGGGFGEDRRGLTAQEKEIVGIKRRKTPLSPPNPSPTLPLSGEGVEQGENGSFPLCLIPQTVKMALEGPARRRSQR